MPPLDSRVDMPNLPKVYLDPADNPPLVELRVLWTRCWARLILFAEAQGIMLGGGECYVMEDREGLSLADAVGPRTSLQRLARKKQKYVDRVHMSGSLHYVGVAGDGVVWRRPAASVAGEAFKYDYIDDGRDPVWKELGEFWESLHPLCVWGGQFGDVDHFSLKYQGRE